MDRITDRKYIKHEVEPRAEAARNNQEDAAGRESNAREKGAPEEGRETSGNLNKIADETRCTEIRRLTMLATPPNPFGQRAKIEEFIKEIQGLKQTDQTRRIIETAKESLKLNDRWLKMKAEAKE